MPLAQLDLEPKALAKLKGVLLVELGLRNLPRALGKLWFGCYGGNFGLKER